MNAGSNFPVLGTVHVQSVLCGHAPDVVARAMAHLERAADIAISAGVAQSVSLIFGDCSPSPALRDSVEALRRPDSAFSLLGYRFFGAGVGSARGHNRLFREAHADAVLLMAPDVMVAPNLLLELAKPFAERSAGLVEAKQLPIEDPKAYDAANGETAWASTACALLPAELFERLGGFDETFFHCNDVDLSWRARLAGRSVVYLPSAFVFRDKPLGERGARIANEIEGAIAVEAALLLACKYDRDDVVDAILQTCIASDAPHMRTAADQFQRRQARGALPRRIANAHKVASFVDGPYSQTRFAL